MTSPNKPSSKPSRVAKMSVKPIWRKKLNPCNTSNGLNVNLPTPMPKPLTPHHEPSQENNHPNKALPNSYIKDTTTSPQAANNWIRYAFSCNVKDLDLELESPYKPYISVFVLDQFLFINSSITRMNLKGCVNQLVPLVGRTLRVCVLNTGFVWIDITSKSVKNLVISGYIDHCDVVDVVKINAPHILSLTIEEVSVLRKVVLLNVSSLVEAKLDYPYAKEEMLKDLILGLQHVKNLKIGYNCQEGMVLFFCNKYCTIPTASLVWKIKVSLTESED
ncbi:hypothetical protein Tco_0664808 [Tanacetum coccineum]